jgi:dethiobiotin synthetase
MSIIVAGIHTGIGKTICSAVLAEALQYDYWKPVQAGDLHATDSMFVSRHIRNTVTKIHDEAYRLAVAASPHLAAEQEEIEITFDRIMLPSTNNGLIIETAGGIMSPLNRRQQNLDMVLHFNLPVVMVCNDYLGSINHSLLSIKAMQSEGIEILGLVFNGREVPSTREYIMEYSGLPTLLSIPYFTNTGRQDLCDFAISVSSVLKNKLNGIFTKG